MMKYMRDATYQIDEDGILDSTFNYLVKHGLENTTVRELCKYTGIAKGSIYYWFSNKQDLICEAAEYGLKKVVEKIFSYAFSNMENLREFFDDCFSEISKYKNELRFIYQMVASPVYGEKIRSKGQDLNFVYDKYVEMLAVRLQCSEEKLKPIVYLFVSAILDYVMWEDKENAQMQLEFIYFILAEKQICCSEYYIGKMQRRNMNSKTMEKDLFEILKDEAGCEYISDLHYGAFNKKAKAFLKNADIENYSLFVLSDVAQYIFGKNMKFESLDEAKKFFQYQNN